MSHDIRTPINGICGMINVADHYADNIGETDGMQGKDQRGIPSVAGTDKRGSGHEQTGVR